LLSKHRMGRSKPQPCTRPTHGRIPAPQLHCQIHNHQDPHHQSTPDPSLELIPQVAGIPALSHKPTALQALLSPSYAWNDRTPPPQATPTHQALPGSSSVWNNWSPALLGQALAWCKTAAPTSLPGTPLLGQSQPQLYRLPRQPLHHAPTRAATRGLQAWLRDTQTGVNTKELKTTRPAILLFQNWWFFFLPS
jgi:hypothetical protein